MSDLMTKRQHIFNRPGWPMPPRPMNSDAHIITNIGLFQSCRRDNLCRCRKCKPPLK